MKSTFINFLMVFILCLIFGSVGGIFCGAVLAGIIFAGYGEDALFGISYGVAIGGAAGLVYGILSAWPLRHAPFPSSIYWLAAGTLAAGLPVALLPNCAPLCFLTGTIAFWITAHILNVRANELREKQKQEMH